VFKAVRIETEEQLIHLSRYIHINPAVSFVVDEKELARYHFSSLPEYIKGESSLLDLKPVLNHFKTPQDYRKFVFDQIAYGKELEKVKHLLLEK
jgi:putative transposase